ncbi:hypothetical protein GS534_00900 [Rhodococcus hoagii]|nr:hypothetical protein [Prescottella equi]
MLTAEQTAKLLARLAVADVKPVSWYRSMEADFASEHFGFPSPGELKHTASDGGKWVWDESMSQWELRQYPPAEPVPDSGPDGTPEKPWPSLNEVPGHVLAVLDVTGVRWARRSASGAWFGCDGQLRCCKGHPEVAPFVRVDGDKE